MKKLLLTFLLIATTAYAQSTASYGVVVTSLSTSSAGVVTGTPFAVPSSYAAIITWQVVSDSGTLVVNLEGSLDNVSWNTIDTTTASSVKNFGFSAVKFVRCSQVSRTGGTSTSCTLVINRGFINNGTANLTRILLADSTASLPAYSFLTAPTTGIFNSGAAVGIATNGAARAVFSSNTVGLQVGQVYPIGWTSNALNVGASETAFTMGNAAGKVTLTGTTPMFQLGGTTSSFPAIKQNGSVLQVRLADDSGYAAITTSNVNLVTSLAGTSPILFVAAPTINSGFGTSPSVTVNNGTASFIINVGTGAVATSGVIGLPAASNGWNCFATDITATSTHTALETEITASTTTTATIESQNRATGAATAWAASSLIRLSCFAY